MSKAVTKKAEAEVALPYDYGTDAGAGMDLTAAERLLPWINVLQANSPAVSKGVGDGGVEGARSGMLMNSVTEELYDGKEGITFIPAARDHEFIEWVPRKRGGGLVARHAPNAPAVLQAKDASSKFGRYNTDYTPDNDGDPSGNDITETFVVYGVQVGEDGFCSPVALSFTSTKITPFKKWREKLLKVGKGKVPFYGNLTRLRTVGQTHKAGDSFGVVFEPAVEADFIKSMLQPDDERFLLAKEIAGQHGDGVLKTTEMEQGGGSGGKEEFPDAAGADAPF